MEEFKEYWRNKIFMNKLRLFILLFQISAFSVILAIYAYNKVLSITVIMALYLFVLYFKVFYEVIEIKYHQSIMKALKSD